MKKKKYPIIENVTITGIAAEGKAIARVDDMVIFVPYCVPGDVVDLQVTKKKHSFMEAQVVRFVKYSDDRTPSICQHYGTCGGCKWQILPYHLQLQYKQQQIVDNLTRIGKIAVPEISPIMGSQQIYSYRNKLEFTCSERKWVSWDLIHQMGGIEQVDTAYGLGFHISNCFDKVLDIDTCYLMDDINNQIRNGIRTYAKEHNITFYNERAHQGQLRTIIIRSNLKGEIMLIVSFGEPINDACKALLDWIHNTFPQIISLLYVENLKFNDTITDQQVHIHYGQDHIIEQMEDLSFKISPKSFYQTNSKQAYELYKVVRDFAQLTGNELVYDLYTGTGTIANFVAKKAKQVIGIEYVPDAIEDAKINAQFNNLQNTLFFAGDMKDILNPSFIQTYGHPDVIITDPPRAGMHEDVIKTILYASPQRIVYVSCNPATQARDLNLLDEAYQVIKIQPVDMFPQTQHVENVVLLHKRI